jgi:tRNA A-37 threonylcarbamoyl transferase component Bud32
MTNPGLLESLALQISDGAEVSWDVEAGPENSTVIDNLHVLEKLAQTLREQDESPDMPDSWGPLRIVELLGSGASSDVYRARDTVLDRDVALKLFRRRDEDAQQRLLQEGRMMARVRHPNIVQVFGAEKHDGRIGLWMELVEGETLDQILERQGPMSAAEAATVGQQLCAALATIHNAGLLYRDLKLQNVIRERGGNIRLMDFGSGIDRDDLVAGHISGTPLYLAPELFDDTPASPQSDIYALGVLLYRLSSGAFPVEADTIEDLQGALAEGHRSLLDVRPDLPEAFIDCVETAIAADPQQRYATPGQFAQVLATAGKPPPSRLRRIAGVLSILLLAIMVIVQWPAQYQLDTTLYRVNADNTRIQLVDGAAVSVGDRLVLEVTTTVPMYVYVFNEDSLGNAWGLFPLAAAGHENPLAADMTHLLPAEGDSALTWVVDSAGISERIHVLASPEPVAQVEQIYRSLPEARLAAPGFEPRGVGSVSAQPGLTKVSAAPMIQAAQELTDEAEIAIGVTYRVIELDNTTE